MYPCPDECGKTWQSLKAALMCPCDREDVYGQPLQVKGGDWIP